MASIKKLQITSLNQRGYTLIEMGIAVFLMGFIALGSSFMIQNTIRGERAALKRGDMSQEFANMQIVMKNAANFTGGCAGIVQPDGTITAGNNTDLTVSIMGEDYEAGYISPSGAFQIDALYLGEVELIGNTLTNNTYSAGIFLEASFTQNNQRVNLPRRRMGSLSLQTDSTNNFIDCDLNAYSVTNQVICETVNNVYWVSSASECTQSVEMDSDGDFDCMGIEENDPAGADCQFRKNHCAHQGMLPGSADNGDFSDCTTLPAGYTITHDTNNVMPPAPTSYTPPPTPTPTGPLTCDCGSSDIDGGDLCMTCRERDNCFNIFETCYYYDVWECQASHGQLQKVNGPVTSPSRFRGTFKQKNDPNKCSRSRSEGGLSSSAGYFQF